MVNWLVHHFSDTHDRRTPARIEAEKTILGMPFKRWMLLPSSVLIQLSLGSFYAWSVYNGPIADKMRRDGATDVNAEAIAETFYVCVGLFGLASAFGGPWLERLGPRRMTLIGCALFAIGNLVSALGCHLNSIGVLYLGYGLIGGTGIGIAYICPVAVLQKWYPEYRGLASGISVGSFGLGSVIASFTQATLLDAYGPITTFIVFGIVYFVISMTCALVMRFPPPTAPQGPHTHSPDARKKSVDVVIHPLRTAPSDHPHPVHSSGTAIHEHYTPSPVPHDTPLHDAEHHDEEHGASAPIHVNDNFLGMLFSRDFGFVFVIFFLSVIPGLVMVSRCADIVKNAFDQSTQTSTWIVAVNGLFNVIGRMLFGALSDKLGRLPLLIFTITLQIVVMVGLLFSFSNVIFPLFVAAMWILTMCYGSALGLIPGLLTDCFGAGNIGALYGVSLIAWAAGGVIGGVGFTAVIKSQRESGVAKNHVFDICLYSMIPLAAIGAIITAIFARNLRRRPKLANDAHH